VLAENVVLEYTATLLRSRSTLDAIEAQDGGVGGEARPDTGEGMRPGEAEQLYEPTPVGLLGQHGGAWLGSGHDQRIQRARQDLLERPVVSPICSSASGDRGSSGSEVRRRRTASLPAASAAGRRTDSPSRAAPNRACCSRARLRLGVR
jgi:hypothetical protein